MNEHHLRIMRFLVSGGAAASTNLAVLYVATEFFQIWYILSACLAFSISLIVSFTLQKVWTFNNNSTYMLHRQFALYICVTVVNLLLNTAILYALVEYVGMYYILAQIITMGLIAFVSYFVYRNFIFTTASSPQSVS